jgi:hypothetical protein
VNGPEVGQDVYLTVGGLGSMNARVVNTAESQYLLTLPSDVRHAGPEFAGRDASVQYSNRRGVCRIEGKVPKKGFIGDRLRFDAAGKPKLIQRRDFVRIDAVVPVKYQPRGEMSPVRDAHALNVSGGGFLLAPPHEVGLGVHTRFWIELSDGEDPVSALGTAVRQSESGAMGIRFDDISEPDRERLVRWVFAQERLSRQVTRDGH